MTEKRHHATGRSGKLRAGIPQPGNRVYSEELCKRIKRRYLTLLVLNYYPTTLGILEMMAREFGIGVSKLRGILYYQRMLRTS